MRQGYSTGGTRSAHGSKTRRIVGRFCRMGDSPGLVSAFARARPLSPGTVIAERWGWARLAVRDSPSSEEGIDIATSLVQQSSSPSPVLRWRLEVVASVLL